MWVYYIPSKFSAGFSLTLFLQGKKGLLFHYCHMGIKSDSAVGWPGYPRVVAKAPAPHGTPMGSGRVPRHCQMGVTIHWHCPWRKGPRYWPMGGNHLRSVDQFWVTLGVLCGRVWEYQRKSKRNAEDPSSSMVKPWPDLKHWPEFQDSSIATEVVAPTEDVTPRISQVIIELRTGSVSRHSGGGLTCDSVPRNGDWVALSPLSLNRHAGRHTVHGCEQSQQWGVTGKRKGWVKHK